MIFIYNANGTVIKNTPEQIFQGSSNANTVYFISPVATTCVVSVGFNLPDGTYTPKYIMELTEQTGLTGTFDINGNVFNMWSVKIPSAITAKAGTVGVQFFVSSHGITAATERVNIPVEQGVYTIEPEQGDSYDEVLQTLSDLNVIVQNFTDQVQTNKEDIADLKTEKQDKLTAGEGITITEDNVISATGNITVDDELSLISEKPVQNKVITAKIVEIESAYGATLDFSINTSTYVLTAELKNKNGTVLSTQTIDLPLESVVVSGSYDNITKSLILTLQNGNTITIPVGDLISGLQTEITAQNPLSADLVSDTDTANKFVSASEKAQIGTNATDIAALQAGKLDKKPDGTADLIDSNNKINVPYLPDFVVGQMLNAGVITSLDGETATAELTTGGKSKLGVSSNTLILTNDTATPTGYLANENNYYRIKDTAGVKDGEVLRNDNLNLLKNTFAYNNYGVLSFTKRSTGSIVIKGNTDDPTFSIPFSTGQTDTITTFIFKARKSYTLSSYNELDGFSNPDYKFGRGAKYYICTNANTSTNDNGLTNSNFWEEITVSEWATGSTYSVGDYVYKIGGRYNVMSTNIHYFYKCIQANTADDTNMPANNASNSYWQLISIPVWDIGNSYSVGNYARDFIEFNLAYDTGFWTHYAYNTNGFIGTDSGERASLVFQKGFATFVNNTDEDIEIRLAMRLFSSDYIISSGVLYKCIVSGLGHPLSDTDYWQVVSFTTWDSSELYSEGDYVVYNGAYYLCRTSNSGNTPSASNEYWVKIRTSGSYNSTDYYSAYNYNDFEIKLAVYEGLFTRETLPEYQPYLSMFAGLYFEVGDWLVATASGWTKIDYIDAVKSINGKTGFVELGINDIPNLREELDGKQGKLAQSTDLTPTTQTLTLTVNTRYALGTLTALDITFPANANDGDEIIIEFVSGSTATTLTRDTINAIYNFDSVGSGVFVEFNAEFKVSIGKWVVYSAETTYGV